MIKTYFVIFTAALILNISSCTKATDIKQSTNSGTLVNISLPKKVYKMYESIELQYEWINFKDKPDTIWALFSEQIYIKQFITDNKGNVYENSKMREPDGIHIPRYIVEKGDTLKKTITLNQFGKKFSDKLEDAYFHCFNYFPPGKYRVYSVIDRDVGRVYPEPIKSNEIEFEITEPEGNDADILTLAQKEKYEEALRLYPSNYFEEYLMNSEIFKHVSEFMKAGEMNERYKDTSVLPLKYNAFFEKYPNSLYNLNDMFFVHYLWVNSRDSAGVDRKMNELLSKYPGTNISWTVNEIMNRQSKTGYSYHYNGYGHKKNGTSKEVKPQTQDKK